MHPEIARNREFNCFPSAYGLSSVPFLYYILICRWPSSFTVLDFFLLLTFEPVLKNKHWPLKVNAGGPVLCASVWFCACIEYIHNAHMLLHVAVGFSCQDGLCVVGQSVRGALGLVWCCWGVGEVGSQSWVWELESWKVMFINCYQCAGA